MTNLMPWIEDERRKLKRSIWEYYRTAGRSNIGDVIVDTYRLVEELKNAAYIYSYSDNISLPIHEIVATKVIHDIERVIAEDKAFTMNEAKRTIEVLECYSKSLYKYMKHFCVE